MLVLAGIMIASLGNSYGPGEGSEGLGPACLPFAQHFSGLSPSSPRLLAQISFNTPPTIPSPAALFLYQAEQPLRHTPSVASMAASSLSWPEGSGTFLGEKSSSEEL